MSFKSNIKLIFAIVAMFFGLQSQATNKCYYELFNPIAEINPGSELFPSFNSRGRMDEYISFKTYSLPIEKAASVGRVLSNIHGMIEVINSGRYPEHLGSLPFIEYRTRQSQEPVRRTLEENEFLFDPKHPKFPHIQRNLLHIQRNRLRSLMRYALRGLEFLSETPIVADAIRENLNLNMKPEQFIELVERNIITKEAPNNEILGSFQELGRILYRKHGIDLVRTGIFYRSTYRRGWVADRTYPKTPNDPMRPIHIWAIRIYRKQFWENGLYEFAQTEKPELTNHWVPSSSAQRKHFGDMRAPFDLEIITLVEKHSIDQVVLEPSALRIDGALRLELREDSGFRRKHFTNDRIHHYFRPLDMHVSKTEKLNGKRLLVVIDSKDMKESDPAIENLRAHLYLQGASNVIFVFKD